MLLRAGKVALIAIGVALIAVMFALGWLIGRIRMIVDALIGAAGKTIGDPKVLIGIAVVAAILGLGVFSAKGKRR